MAKPAIEVIGLSKSFHLGGVPPSPLGGFGHRETDEEAASFWALKDITFNVEPGEMVGVIGRNGAGKSTLLKILSRITGPSSGKAILRGRASSLLEVGTGFHQDLTGRENIFLNGSILGMPRKEIARKFEKIVDFAEVHEFLDTPVKFYSSGMYLRLAFAVAAHLEPEILLVDEVLAVGDFAFQQKCLEETEHIAQSGRSILFVSHNLSAVSRLCRRTILLEHGRITTMGPTTEVLQTYISRGISQRSEYQRQPNPENVMSLTHAAVYGPDGKCREEIGYQEGLRIDIDIEYVVREPTEGLSCAIGVGTSNREPVFVSAEFDGHPERLSLRQPGQYLSSVELPGKWLNTGQYLVMIYLTNVDRNVVYEKIEALTFTITETGSPASYLGVIQRKGVLQPDLDWATTRLEK